jgi:hypothetical protein
MREQEPRENEQIVDGGNKDVKEVVLPKRLAMATSSAPRRSAERVAATSGNEVMRATNRVLSIRRYKGIAPIST